ncbi:MAG: Mannan endo,4-beta-mannosidase [Anaerocolumna sp.]|jgi:mannan endo-1,4-beta-mannosidase|nr:Mannan endo,4-beta-mannosidase [Anaerocolumna sp.]
MDMKKKRFLSVILVCVLVLLVACSKDKTETKVTPTPTVDATETDKSNDSEPTPTPTEALLDEVNTEPTAEELAAFEAFDQIYEAEDAKLLGRAIVDSKKEGFSGTGYVDGMANDNDGCEFTITVPANGFYDLNFVSASYDGHKENTIQVDKDNIGVAIIEEKEFSDSIMNKVYMTKGEHTIKIIKSWGWIYLDYLRITPSKPMDETVFNVSSTLINPNADDNTKRLMSFLTDNYGKYTLAGQFADKGRYSKELWAIQQATGNKIPAILGLDLMEYTPSRVEKGSTSKTVEYAIEFDQLGGIISMCWHWNAPTKYLTTKEPWYSGFYTKATTIDLAKIMNGEDKEGYDLLISDIDAIAEQLKRIQEAGVPLLWRPLHEASGGWFWWGAAGSDAYKELWKLLYDRLTNYHKINNLIWVWNGQNKDWYPGDEFVDIIGEDIYPGEKVYTSQIGKFNAALDYTDTNKIIAMTENGCLFDPDLAFRDDARWAWFSTWSGDFVIDTLGALSEQYNERDMLNKVYNHEKVLTLDELPDLKNYPIK